jgi:hypothetical protein
MKRIIADLERQFARLDQRWRDLIAKASNDCLYRRPERATNSTQPLSCAEIVLRSAGVVEQTFGGITVNLWDDPFEWTLPETLATPAKLIEYFDEVEATRKRGFDAFNDDAELEQEIVTPAGDIRLGALLLDTLARAKHYQETAEAALELTAKSSGGA